MPKGKSDPSVGENFKGYYEQKWLEIGSLCSKCSSPMKPNSGYTLCLSCNKEAKPATAPTKTTFHQKLAALGFKTYKEYLESDHWQDFRKKFFRSKRAKHCACCPVRTIEVELHHCTYDRLGRELLKDVIPLCREHHELVHSLLDTRHGGDVTYTNRVISSLVPRRGKRGRRWASGQMDYDDDL